ncbi:MAG: metallophosphoesterase [Proteobacteria bacterium]|nr:metallophosphoesterase [Pseudomonadota bacterium]
MTRLLHLTDLHFGSERADLVQPLHEAVVAARPDLLIVSGDLTHRARAGQFRRAMEFLRGLGLPFVTLPGNHDIPLFNLPARFLATFGGWQRHVAPDLSPMREAGAALIFCANTADPYRWRGGQLRDDDLRRIFAGLKGRKNGMVPILACHHPLKVPAGFRRDETHGVETALPGLVRDGLQVVLTGHLHHWEIGLGITEATPQPLLMVQTGTALCDRPGERDHGFSVLDLEADAISVTPWIAADGTAAFRPATRRRFLRRDGLWHLAG